MSRSVFAIGLAALISLPAAVRADETPDAGAPEARGAAPAAEPETPSVPAEAAQNAEQSTGYTPDPAASNPALKIRGYFDIGFARAGGNGTSYSPNETTVPLDYGVDTFAPAVNSRGDVASTN